jgi:hypothetical protein
MGATSHGASDVNDASDAVAAALGSSITVFDTAEVDGAEQ